MNTEDQELINVRNGENFDNSLLREYLLSNLKIKDFYRIKIGE